MRADVDSDLDLMCPAAMRVVLIPSGWHSIQRESMIECVAPFAAE